MEWCGQGMNSRACSLNSDVRFVTTLAGQAALAVANAHFFLNVEVSRRQLEAILNSTPDPVLVTDHRNRLLLANRAAAIALGQTQTEDTTSDIGRKTEQVVKLSPAGIVGKHDHRESIR